MCGRYTLRKPGVVAKAVYQHDFKEFSEIKIEPKFTSPRFNIAPSQQIITVRRDKSGQQAIDMAKWGFTPSWTIGKPKFQPINATAEKVATSPMFKKAFARRRCLIPADGYYEWHADGKEKTPYFFHLPKDEVFWFAGISEWWDEAEQETTALITTEPNDVQRPIHNRMPVLLTGGDIETWLSEKSSPDDLLDLLRPYEGELLVHEVGRQVNSPRNDSEENVEPTSR